MALVAGARAGARLLQLRPLPTRGGAPSSLTPTRGLAADHGPARVNLWEEPLNPGKWKEEHFVFASLGFWGLLFYGGYKAATGGSKKPEKVIGDGNT